jgi:hypothetical protein
MKEKLTDPLRKVLPLLVGEKYAELELFTKGIRLSAKEIARAVANYGRKLVLPPEEGFQLMDVIEVKNAQPRRWSIAMPLWTQEEGRSDLTLEITVIEQQNDFLVELDDIHIL